MSLLVLVVASKHLSSWSLRPWLVVEHLGVPYREVVVPLRRPDTAERIRAHSPSGRLPALVDGETRVWDSLAICEYLAERHPAARLWPEDPATRAFARSIVCEMHAGFAALRQELPVDFRAAPVCRQPSPAAAADIARIRGIWRECRARYGAGGPFLFGHFTIADAFYAPVVGRFRTHGVALDGPEAAWADAIWALPAMQKWLGAAQAE
jgi:glutathione S-transferase